MKSKERKSSLERERKITPTKWTDISACHLKVLLFNIDQIMPDIWQCSYFFLIHISLLIVLSVMGTQMKYIVHSIGGRVESNLFSLQWYLRGMRFIFTSEMQRHSEKWYHSFFLFHMTVDHRESVRHWWGVLMNGLSTNPFPVEINNNAIAQEILWFPSGIQHVLVVKTN